MARIKTLKVTGKATYLAGSPEQPIFRVVLRFKGRQLTIPMLVLPGQKNPRIYEDILPRVFFEAKAFDETKNYAEFGERMGYHVTLWNKKWHEAAVLASGLKRLFGENYESFKWDNAMLYRPDHS